MDSPSPSIRNLSRKLLAIEAAGRAATDAPANEAVLVCEKLRLSLTRFVGADGFAGLQRRAIALARREVPGLQHVTVSPDGSLEGLETSVAETTNSDEAAAIIVHLLGLLVTFIGEPLTLRLVRDAWSGVLLDE
jgi:hypothetical protein